MPADVREQLADVMPDRVQRARQVTRERGVDGLEVFGPTW
jgi:hypothetical protein